MLLEDKKTLAVRPVYMLSNGLIEPADEQVHCSLTGVKYGCLPCGVNLRQSVTGPTNIMSRFER
jgi:hypothetical protein